MAAWVVGNFCPEVLDLNSCAFAPGTGSRDESFPRGCFRACRLADCVPSNSAGGPQRPLSNGLAADFGTALRQEFLDISQAQREPEIQPHRVPDDLSWKPVALVGNRLHCSLCIGRIPHSGEKLGFD
mgnify:CR=1 FL=1